MGADEFKEKWHQRGVLVGEVAPSQDTALKILLQMIPQLPMDFHVYTYTDLEAIAPIPVMISQKEWKADFHLIMGCDIVSFLHQSNAHD